MADEKSSAFTEADGRRLAVDMLIEIEGLGLDEIAITPETRDGRSQANTVTRYLACIRTHGNSHVEAGFVAVLTDFIGTALAGVPTEPDFYEQHVEPAQRSTDH